MYMGIKEVGQSVECDRSSTCCTMEISFLLKKANSKLFALIQVFSDDGSPLV